MKYYLLYLYYFVLDRLNLNKKTDHEFIYEFTFEDEDEDDEK